MHTAAACGLAAWLAAATAWAQTATATPPRGPVVHGMDWSLSGFATVGHVVSDRDWRWRRFVDEGGTLWRDTIVGGQLDARLSPSWSATLQLTLAPSNRHERQWSVEAAWAFLSWRPDNDWLLRLGKQRVPIFLNAENRDVG